VPVELKAEMPCENFVVDWQKEAQSRLVETGRIWIFDWLLCLKGWSFVIAESLG
jgi:hypothetical protein